MASRVPYGVLAFVCFSLATLSLLVCTIAPEYVSRRVQQAITEQIIWSPSSPKDVWARHERNDNPNDPLDLIHARMFNITNVDDVRRGAKPILEEVGPYVYQKHRRKVDIWFGKNGHVKYKIYDFNVPRYDLGRNASADIVYTANIPLMGALEKARSLSPQAAALLAGYVQTFGDPHNVGLFMKRTPHEMLWGYEDPLAAMVKRIVPSFQSRYGLMPNDSSLEVAMSKPFEVMDTGVRDVGKVFETIRWTGLDKVTSWNNYTERVHGTDASQFTPGQKLNSTVDVWVGELYRAAKLVAVNTTNLHGVDLLRFVPTEGAAAPDPRYFQTIQGLMNITSPQAGGPAGPPGESGPLLFLAYPHFCGADPLLSHNVTGLQCDPERHTLFLDVEPITGITMRAAKRLMLVTHFGEQYHMMDPHLSNTFLPVFWAEETAAATPKACTIISRNLYGAIAIRDHARAIGFLATVVFSLAMLLLVVMGCFTSGMHKRLRVEPSPGSQEANGVHAALLDEGAQEA